MNRFEMYVSMTHSGKVDQRMDLFIRRMWYEKEPAAFLNEFLASEEDVSSSVRKARERAAYIIIPPVHLDAIAKLCHDLGVQGHRGDIALARTASALAALDGRDQIVLEDLQA